MPDRDMNQFVDALGAHEGEVTLTESSEFTSSLQEAVEKPAVGVALNIEDVSLADTDVALNPTRSELDSAATGVTPVTFGVAERGSVLIPSTREGTEQISLFVDHHVAVLRRNDLVSDMTELFEALGPAIRENRSSQIIATGPSATADMGDLVYGAHGPQSVHVICLTDR